MAGFSERNLQNIKRVFRISPQHLPEKFLILLRTQRDIMCTGRYGERGGAVG